MLLETKLPKQYQGQIVPTIIQGCWGPNTRMASVTHLVLDPRCNWAFAFTTCNALSANSFHSHSIVTCNRQSFLLGATSLHFTCGLWCECRFKGGEEKVLDKEKQLAGKLKQGAQKAGRTAEHDYERYTCFHRVLSV